jgi:lysophospholipase L1-like esterase
MLLAVVSSVWSILCTIAVLLTGQERETVFLGDSIVAGLGYSTNLGDSGAPTSRIVDNARRVPASAQAVFYEGGINDIGNGWDDQIVSNYRLMLARKPYLAKAYLIGILPVDESKLDLSWASVANNRKIAALNDKIAAQCPSCIRVKVDLPPGSHQSDGIHLTPVGYEALRRAIDAAR